MIPARHKERAQLKILMSLGSDVSRNPNFRRNVQKRKVGGHSTQRKKRKERKKEGIGLNV